MAVVPLEYRFDGPTRGPVVLMVPALGALWSMWEPQMPELTRAARVLRVNLRGHGASPAPPGDYTLREMADDLVALLDRRELERVTVVASSLGGMVALCLALSAPDRVDRLALVSTTALAAPVQRWQDRAERARASGTRGVVRELTRGWFTPTFADQRPDVVARMVKEAGDVDPAGLAGCCAAVAGGDQRTELTEIRSRTMVIAAAHDTVTPPAHGRRVAARIPRARFEVVHGGAHLVNIERADRINELLVDHLAGALT